MAILQNSQVSQIHDDHGFSESYVNMDLLQFHLRARFEK